jgi:predicted double-glycine peptidase
MLALPCLLAVLYYVHIFDHCGWYFEVRTLPGIELSFAGIGWLGGAFYRSWEPQSWREGILIPLATAGLLLTPFLKPLLAPIRYAQMQDLCTEQLCRQSTPSSCGPASAATLAHYLGSPLSEKELAKESFTYIGGTEAWYLARTLRHHGFTTRFIFSREIPQQPAIAGVRLANGLGHFIAILNSDAASITLVDPAVGRMTLNRKEVQQQFQFTGFFMTVEAAPGK